MAIIFIKVPILYHNNALKNKVNFYNNIKKNKNNRLTNFYITNLTYSKRKGFFGNKPTIY